MTDDASTTTEERARLAVEHLQTAALEMINAARAALDVAEDLVRDPGILVAGARTMTPTPSKPDTAGAPATPRVQHIRVS